MLPTGDIESEAIDWFADPYSCVEQGYIEEESAAMGVGFVCVEDYVEKDK